MKLLRRNQLPGHFPDSIYNYYITITILITAVTNFCRCDRGYTIDSRNGKDNSNVGVICINFNNVAVAGSGENNNAIRFSSDDAGSVFAIGDITEGNSFVFESIDAYE